MKTSLSQVGFALLFVLILTGYNLADVWTTSPAASTAPSASRISLPSKCASLRTTKDEATWDPVKEEYPRNEAWEICMGVGPAPVASADEY